MKHWIKYLFLCFAALSILTACETEAEKNENEIKKIDRQMLTVRAQLEIKGVYLQGIDSQFMDYSVIGDFSREEANEIISLLNEFVYLCDEAIRMDNKSDVTITNIENIYTLKGEAQGYVTAFELYRDTVARSGYEIDLEKNRLKEKAKLELTNYVDELEMKMNQLRTYHINLDEISYSGQKISQVEAMSSFQRRDVRDSIQQINNYILSIDEVVRKYPEFSYIKSTSTYGQNADRIKSNVSSYRTLLSSDIVSAI